MKVSELARQAGVTPSTLRFYEAEGILPAPRRTASGYREYDQVDLCRVRMLASLRALGIELPEAGRLAGMCADGRCDDMAVDLLPRIAARRAEVAAARIELDHLDAELRHLQQSIEADGPLSTQCLDDGGLHQGAACCEEGSCDDPTDRDR